MRWGIPFLIIKDQKFLSLIFLFRHSFQKIFGNEIIGIHKNNPLPTALLYPEVPGHRYPFPFLIKKPDTRVPFAVFHGNLRTVVCGAVIDQNDLYVLLGGIKHGVNTSF